jgi:type I restriction enzyme R subunit
LSSATGYDNFKPPPDQASPTFAHNSVKAMEAVCAEEGIVPAAFQRLVEDYQFTGKPPLREAVIDVLEQKPKILERKKITERIIDKLLGLVATFDDGLGGI